MTNICNIRSSWIHLGVSLSVAGIVVTSYKLSQFIRSYGVQLSVTQLCLAAELLASILRAIYYLDPWQIFAVTNHVVSSILKLRSFRIILASEQYVPIFSYLT